MFTLYDPSRLLCFFVIYLSRYLFVSIRLVYIYSKTIFDVSETILSLTFPAFLSRTYFAGVIACQQYKTEYNPIVSHKQ